MNAARPRLPVHRPGRRGGSVAIVLLVFAALAFASAALAQGADRTRPVLQSATVSGAVLVLTYDEALLEDGSPHYDGIQPPQSVQFELYVNNAARPLYADTVAVSGRTVTLRFPSAVMAGDAVALSYTRGIFPIRDLAENRAAAFKRRAVTNTTDRVVVAPSAPRRLSAAGGDRQVVLSWDAPESDGGSAVTGYEVRLGAAGGAFGTWTPAGDGAARTHEVRNLDNGTAYMFELRAVNRAGLAGAPASASARTDAAAVPSAPVLTAEVAAQWGITLGWSAPDDDGGADISGFELQVSSDYSDDGDDGNDTWTGLGGGFPAAQAISYTHAGLAPGTKNYYRVRALNEAGPGAWSAVASATTWPKPVIAITRDGDDGSGTVSEAVGALVYTLTRSGPLWPPVRVAVAVTQSGDYIETEGGYTAPSSATFTAGSATAGITVRIADDAVDEADGSVTVTVGPGAYDTDASSPLAVTVTDDDVRGVTVSPASLEVAEGGSATYTVALASQPTGPVTVRVSGHAGTDLTPDPSSLNFTASNWNTPKDVTVTAAQDDDTDDHTVTLTHTASGADYGAVTADLAVTVADDDTPTYALSFGESRYEVVEGAGTLAVTVRLAPAAPGTVTVGWATVDGTAEAPDDYTAASGTLVFAAGETAKTVSVAVVDDVRAEETEVFGVRLSGPTGAALPRPAEVEVGIADDDLPPGAGEVADGALRLRDGSASDGRLEVFLGGQWGTVCNDHFDRRDANVACRQLGFARGEFDNTRRKGEGFPILLDDLHCTGTESRLVDCGHTSEHNCVHYEDVSVQCHAAAEPGAPRELSASPDDRQVVLSWDAPSSDGGAAVERYEYRYGESGASFGAWTSAGTERTATVTGLVNGRRYAFEVRAVNSFGAGEAAGIAETPAAGPLRSFTLFDNAAGGADVAALSPGAVLEGLASERLNIRAEVAPGAEVGSVKLALSGRQSASRTENLAPYALFGDRGGQAFPSGTYTLTATPYAEANLGGAPGPALSMTFTVAAADRTAPSVTVTSGAQGPVSGEFEVTVAFSEPVSGFRMSELAIVNGQAARMLSAPGGTLHTVTVAPDEGASGEVTVTVPAGVAADAAGNPNTASETLRIALAPPPLRVTGFTLFDHAAGRDVAALTAGAVLPAQSSDRLNIRAEVAGAAGSVGFALSGRASAAGTENVAPWYLFGDLGNRGARALPAGTYTVTATPYAEANLGGTAGRALSVTFRVKAHELVVADARAEEGRDETIDFTVTLAPASPAAVTVDYATADGSATAGEDYTAASGTLVFAPGETSKTVAVPVLDDAIDEGEETFTLTLSDPSGAELADAEAVGTITNSDPLQKMWLSRFGRTVASHVVDAVAGRLSGPSGGSQVTLGGQSIALSALSAETVEARRTLAGALGAERAANDDGPLAGPGAWEAARAGSWADPETGHGSARTVTGRELLLGSSFHLAAGGGEAGGPGYAAWGRVAVGGFDAKAPAETGTVRLDGEVTTGILGADAQWERWLAGVALSVSEGEGTFDQPGVDSGEVESTLTSVNPYVRYRASDRLSAWGLLGYGTGDMTMTQAARGERAETVTRTDISMRLGAAGARGVLVEADEGGGIDLALRGDAFLVQMDWEKVSNETDTRADASRLRLVLDGSRGFALGEGAVLTPALELGLRHDGGDAETGTGVEVGGRIRYADAGSGLTVEASARTLIAHEDSGYREWGAGGSVRLDPGASGRGLSLSLAPVWGTPSSGVERLWSARDAAGLAPGGEFEAERRLEGELGYGLGAFGGRGLVTPYAGLGLAEAGSRTWRAGARWSLAPHLAMSLDGTRREPANDDAPEHGVQFRLTVRW